MQIFSESSSPEKNEQFPSNNKLGGAVVFVWKTSGIKSF